MLITLNDIVTSTESLRKLTTLDLPIKISFRLLELTKQLEVRLTSFEETRLTLLKKYGTQTDATNFKIEDVNVEPFSKEMEELLSEELDVNFVKISVDSLPDSISISAADLRLLSWLFVQA